MWAEAIAGGLGGLSNGVSNIQDQRKQQIQLQLQQEAAKRQAVQQAQEQLMQQYKTVEPGSVVDPEQASKYKAAGFGGLEKGENGQIIRAKTPQDQLMDLKLGEAEQDASDRMKRTAFLDKIHNDGADYFKLPLQQRLMDAVSNGYEKPDIVMSPEEKMQYNPTYGAALIRGQASQTAAAMRQQATPMQKQNFRLNLENAAEQHASRLVKPHALTGELDIAAWEAAKQDYLTKMGHGPQQATPTGNEPPDGTEGVVQGVPAIWIKGQGWVEK